MTAEPAAMSGGTTKARLARPLAVFNAGPFARMKDGFFDACGGDNDVLFARTLGFDMADIRAIDLEAGDPLPKAGDVAGVVISGSVAMITERRDWAERTARWIADNAAKVPILGVCFGHQLVAHALGGRVDWCAKGSEYGTRPIVLTDEGAADPLFAGTPARFKAQAAHSQGVKELPGGALLLAHNDHSVQAVRYAAMAWGTQFHPEFDKPLMEVLFRDYRDELGRIGVDVPAAAAALEETSSAMSVLGNFAAIVRSGAAVVA
ncbi:MAG: glutamine amidotransferase [Hyphomicrobiaceae bacterium]